MKKVIDKFFYITLRTSVYVNYKENKSTNHKEMLVNYKESKSTNHKEMLAMYKHKKALASEI